VGVFFGDQNKTFPTKRQTFQQTNKSLPIRG
jgi:hypothetical protein